MVLALMLTSCASAEDVSEASSDPATTSASPTSAPTTPTSPSDSTVVEPTTSSPTTSAPPTTNEPQVASRPKVGNCYDTMKQQFRNQRDGSFPVSCRRLHTAETFAVFRVDPYPRAGEIYDVWRKCQPRFRNYVGAPATISKLDLTVMLPSTSQVVAGQDWIRCDAIEKASYNSRIGVPRRGSLEGVLSEGVPNRYRGCALRIPKVDLPVLFTPCNQPHQAELIPESLFLGPPDAPYPGVKVARAKSKQFCENVFQAYVPETLNYYYYFPKRAAWKSGSHNSTCWAVDTEGNGLPPI